MKSSIKNKNNTFQRIYTIVRSISPGKVATYGQIAALVGPGLPARIVGYALHGLPDKTDVPWHRVINGKGKISFSPTRNDHDSLQKYLLKQEGVRFNFEDKVDLEKYLWHPDE